MSDAAEPAPRLLGRFANAPERCGALEVSLHLVRPGALPALPGTSRGFALARPGLLLVLRAGESFAVGEASPLPGFGGDDSLDRAASELTTFDWSRLDRATNVPPSSIDFTRLTSGLSSASARHALEGAALQLWSKVDPSSLLAALAGPELVRVNSPECRVQPSTVLDPLASDYRGALTRALDHGYRALKLKCGRDVSAEITAIREAAHLLNERRLVVSLRLDANLSLDAASALALVDGTIDTGFSPRTPSGSGPGLTLDWIEDPTRRIEEWRALSARCLVAADEVLLDPTSRTHAFASGARVFIAKPMMLGGVTPVLELARRARESGGIVSLSHAFDGPVALALAARLAALLQPRAVAAGLGRHAALSGWTTASVEPPLPPGLCWPELDAFAPSPTADGGAP